LLDIRDASKELIRRRRFDLRKGQAMMIVLNGINKELYDKITGTENDPFYDNKKIPNFEKAVLQYYKNK